MRNGDYLVVLAPPDWPGTIYLGKYAYEHQVVFWQTHGRLPPKGWVVHHRDENKDNNAPGNLQEKTSFRHAQDHGYRPLRHGTAVGYRRGCRCSDCRRGHADCQTRWRAGG